MDKKRYFGDLMLFLAAFIWGTAFVAQVTGMDKIGPFTFNMARSVIAIICLGAYLIITKAKLPKDIGVLLQGGLVCGFLYLWELLYNKLVYNIRQQVKLAL